MLKINKFYGMTLVELMVGLVISAILLTALIAVVVFNVNHYQKSLNMMRLNQQLETILDIMTSDIRRAGYWANARSDVGLHQNNNPFMTNTTDLSISGSCILFTYDKDSNGSLPAISNTYNDERFGFRLSSNIIQARPPGAAFDCSATDWENVTDSNIIQITNLSFTPNNITITTGPGTRGIVIRNVAISITGNLTSDTSITKTLTQSVRIRNDKYIP